MSIEPTVLSDLPGPVRCDVGTPAQCSGDSERTATMTDNQASGGTRPFRFGVVAPLRTDLPAWRDQVRRIADIGFSTLLMPDVPQWQPAPGPTLAVAATLADLRVGTWVYASPLRRPGVWRGKRTRCRCLLKVASRWASAPGDPGSRTNCASWACRW